MIFLNIKNFLLIKKNIEKNNVKLKSIEINLLFKIKTKFFQTKRKHNIDYSSINLLSFNYINKIKKRWEKRTCKKSKESETFEKTRNIYEDKIFTFIFSDFIISNNLSL